MAKHCISCGHKLTDEDVFCPECGMKNDAIKNESTEPQQKRVTKAPQQKEGKPLAKTTKMLLALAAVLIVAFGGMHFYAQSATDTEKIMATVVNGIDNENKAVLDTLKIDKDTAYNAELYFQYVLDNFEIEDLQEKLVNAGDYVKENGGEAVVKSYGDTPVFTVEGESFLLFYKKPVVKPIAKKMSVETDFEEITVDYGSDKTVTAKSGTTDIGSFLPGEYTFTIGSKAPYIDKFPYIMAIDNSAESNNAIIITREAHAITVKTDDNAAIIYVNGKSTEQKVADLPQIGPFEATAEVEIMLKRKNKDGKEEATESVVVELLDDKEVELNFAKEEEPVPVPKAAPVAANNSDMPSSPTAYQNFFTGYRTAYQDALNNVNPSYLDPYIVSGTGFYYDVRNFIANTSSRHYYDFRENTVTDVAVSGNTATISTFETFYFTGDEGVATYYERRKQYDIIRDNSGNYLINRVHINDTKIN